MNFEPTVFVIDDDPAVRNAMRFLLESVQMNVQTFASAEQFLQTYTVHMIGCAVVDVRMPGMSGLQLQQRLIQQAFSLPMIFITGHGDVPLAVRAMQNGAAHFLEKPLDDQLLLDAINAALAQDKINQQKRLQLMTIQARLANLTEREHQVFTLVIDKTPSKQIAEKLGISLKTVEYHRARMMEKMHADSILDLLEMTRDARLI
ncbi:response regulator transcription factor [Thiothrix nivea]|uniref:Two component transcriptional regulator, LuxR family n=1 Tax=Thiothrix nivea (strain ATCC 35100 / DSM 5205 / JP2) TaxID=870187 RepID=A0A656HIV5_THINJ|nr:response regulator [Thiothrix nivea]EIJ35426.1 two component transcriptional regulator, LuxR family [Thiothrix nivea DSM 5205]